MIANVLGTEYTITVKPYLKDEYFQKNNCDGYCDSVDHKIVICDMKTHPLLQNESRLYCDKIQSNILRHELIHAFFSESGLQDSAGVYTSAWTKNEELVDWIAIQFPKILKVFKKCNCVE